MSNMDPNQAEENGSEASKEKASDTAFLPETESTDTQAPEAAETASLDSKEDSEDIEDKASAETGNEASPKSKPSPKPKAKSSAKKAVAKSAADTQALDDDEEDGFDEEMDEEEELQSLESALADTDRSKRMILVVDEEGQRRDETATIIRTILPNSTIECADDPEEAEEIMLEGDFDTYVVNFLMPGYSSSNFVKNVCNHPDHPLLIGFAADKMSDAVDPKKGLKIIPLKRLFEMDASAAGEEGEEEE